MSDLPHFVLSNTPSIANRFLAELRDPSIQHDRMRFRTNLERIGEILAYELSKTFVYQDQQIPTPLGALTSPLPHRPPVLISVLRAGLPLHQGVLNYFDQADSGFIGAYRHSEQGHHSEFSIQLDYESIPDLQDRPLILIDPMLATGKTLVKVLQRITAYGTPSHIHIVAAIAAPEGIAFLEDTWASQPGFPKTWPSSFSLWVGAIDDHLNANAYIVPGLGDAGDLAFGTKR